MARYEQSNGERDSFARGVDLGLCFFLGGMTKRLREDDFGVYPAAPSMPEFQLQVLTIISGYRQPRLLQDEGASAASALGSDGGIAPLLQQVASRLATLEMKRKYRRESLLLALPEGVLKPSAEVGVDKEAFFKGLADPSVPLVKLYNVPKMGRGLFLETLFLYRVPVARALWAFRAGLPQQQLVGSVISNEVIEKAIGSSSAPMLAYAQAFIAYGVGNECFSVVEVFRGALQAPSYMSQEKKRRLLVLYFMAPLATRLYEENAGLALKFYLQARKDFSDMETGPLWQGLTRTVVPASGPLVEFETTEQIVMEASRIVSMHCHEEQPAKIVRALRRAIPCNQWPVVFGILTWGQNMKVPYWTRQTVIDIVCEVMRLLDGQCVVEGVMRFVQCKSSFAMHVLAALVRRGIVSFAALHRWSIVARVASEESVDILHHLPGQSLDQSSMCASRDLVACCLQFLDFGNAETLVAQLENAPPNVIDACEDEIFSAIDFTTDQFADSSPSIREFCECIQRQNRFFDLALIAPIGERLAQRALAILLEQPKNVYRDARLMSALCRVFSCTPSVRSRLVTWISEKDELKHLVGTMMHGTATASVSIEIGDESALGTAQRGLVLTEHSQVCLSVALEPQSFRAIHQLLLALPTFDPLLCILSKASLVNRGDDLPCLLWNRTFLARTIAPLSKLQDYESLSFTAIKACCVALESPIEGLKTLLQAPKCLERYFFAVKEILAQLPVEQKGDLFTAQVLAILLPVLCGSLSANVRLYFNAHFCHLVSAILFSFSGNLQKVQLPTKEPLHLECVAQLEQIAPFELAVTLKTHLQRAHGKQMSTTRPLFIEDPQAEVPGWKVCAKSDSTTLLQTMLD